MPIQHEGSAFEGLSVVTNPAGTFSLVGRVPLNPRCVRFLRPTDAGFRSAIMGQRVVYVAGRTYGWTGRGFPSEGAARRALRHAGASK